MIRVLKAIIYFIVGLLWLPFGFIGWATVNIIGFLYDSWQKSKKEAGLNEKNS